jgi:IS30 family transposase
MSVEMDQKKQPKQQLEWRRERIAELSAQGRTEREIASILRVGKTTVNRDLAYLNKQARDNLKFYVQERLPEQYFKCQNGLNQVLKMAWNMIIMDSVNQPKTQALSLISECYRYQMDLVSNGVVITDAVKYVNGKMDYLNAAEKKLLQDIQNQKKEEAEAVEDINEGLDTEQQTHNTVF